MTANNLSVLVENKNTLIVVLGWEERFLSGFKLDILNNKFGICFIIIYEDYFMKNEFSIIMQMNLDIVKDICINNSITLNCINFTYSKPSEMYFNSRVEESFKNLTNCNILIDISTIPREMIWSLLTFLKEQNVNIKLIYHKPVSYDKNWLCRDFEKPILQLGHSGISKFGAKTALIIITGFDFERTKQLINHFEPDIVYLCIQEGDQFENTKRNVENHKLFSNQDQIIFIEIDSYNIDLGSTIIISIIENLEEYNIIISSQGPKLSSIIAYNAFLKYPNIGLTYVPSKEININYSKGLKETIEYNYKF